MPLAIKSIEIDERRPGHPQVKIAGHGEVTGQSRILQVPDAWRAHAGLGEPVVEPCGGAVAEVSAHCLVDRAEHLEQHKNRARKRQRAAQSMALLHRADEHAHGNRERRRQHPAQQQDGPPGRSETRVRLGQDGEELPFLAGSQAFEHDRILSQSRGLYNRASFAGEVVTLFSDEGTCGSLNQHPIPRCSSAARN